MNVMQVMLQDNSINVAQLVDDESDKVTNVTSHLIILWFFFKKRYQDNVELYLWSSFSESEITVLQFIIHEITKMNVQNIQIIAFQIDSEYNAQFQIKDFCRFVTSSYIIMNISIAWTTDKLNIIWQDVTRRNKTERNH